MPVLNNFFMLDGITVTLSVGSLCRRKMGATFLAVGTFRTELADEPAFSTFTTSELDEPIFE